MPSTVFALFINAPEATIETDLELLFPFAKAVFLEVATILFLGIGLGHKPKPHVPTRAVANENLVLPAPSSPPRGGRRRDDKIVLFVDEFRRHGRNPETAELQAAFHISRSTAWRYATAA
jgi:hypothetical protein